MRFGSRTVAEPAEQIGVEGACDGVTMRGWRLFCRPYPGLGSFLSGLPRTTSWANICRPSGAVGAMVRSARFVHKSRRPLYIDQE
jgi:hypothetical protein